VRFTLRRASDIQQRHRQVLIDRFFEANETDEEHNQPFAQALVDSFFPGDMQSRHGRTNITLRSRPALGEFDLQDALLRCSGKREIPQAMERVPGFQPVHAAQAQPG
jgi:hypothetical protein